MPVKLPGVVGGATGPRPHSTSESQSAEATSMDETGQVRQDEQTSCGSAGGPVLAAQGGQGQEDGEVMLQHDDSTKHAGGVEESVASIPVEDSRLEPGGISEEDHVMDCYDSDGDEVDDEEGWITPDNIEQARLEMGGCVGEELRDVRVGCMTADFAMQVSGGQHALLVWYREMGEVITVEG